MSTWTGFFYTQLQNISLFLMALNALVHIIFAGAVAKDSGELKHQKKPLLLVSGITWAFATLIGGVFVAVIYWFLHHATFIHRK